MKTMKKLIAISLAVVMLVALAVPAVAHVWHDSFRDTNDKNTANLIAPDNEEVPLNAGKLPNGASVTIGTNDEDWKYAYPYTLSKAYYAWGQTASVNVDADLYFMYDGTNLYVREVHYDDIEDISQPNGLAYRFIVSGVEMVENTKTAVGAEVLFSAGSLVDANATSTATAVSATATTLQYAWSTNDSNSVGTYKAQPAFTDPVSSVYYKDENENFVLETVIPWTGLGLTACPAEGTLLGFKLRILGKYNVISNLGNDTGKTYHNEWDWFAPMYLCGVDDTASSQSIRTSFDTAWYNDSSTEFELKSAKQLRGLAYLVNTQTSAEAAKAITDGKTFKLGADIDLNLGSNPMIQWVPIGIFAGKFDGQGHKISHMVCGPEWNIRKMTGVTHASWERNMGLVAHADGNVEIKNLVIADAKIHSNFCAGGLIGVVLSTAQSVKIQNVYIDADVSIDCRTKNAKYNYGNGNSFAGILIGRGLATGENWATVKDVVCVGGLDVIARASGVGGIGSGPIWGTHSGASANISDVLIMLDENKATGYAINTTTLDEGAATNQSWRTQYIANGTAGKWVETNTVNILSDGTMKNTAGTVTALPADWVNIDESNTIKMPASVAAMLDTNLWVQEKFYDDKDTMDIRVLTVLDAKEGWTEFGIKVEAEVDGAFVEIPGGDAFKSNKVYTSIVAANEPKTAEQLGGKYVGGVVLTNSPKTITLKITPVKYVDGVAYEGGASIVEYVDGVLQ